VSTRDERGGEDREEIGEQQFMHGLLSQAHEEPSRKLERLERLFHALDEEAQRAKPVGPRALRWAASLAASLLAVAAVMLFATGGESAFALVQRSIEVSRQAGNRRYSLEVWLTEEPGDAFLRGELDVRDQEHLVLRLETPYGFDAAIGRDEESAWIAHVGGPHVRLPSGDWPRWLRLDQSAVLVEPIDALLERLVEGYELERDGQSPLVRVVARRAMADEAQPEVVELEIDAETHRVVRMELSWPSLAHTLEDYHREMIDAHQEAHAGDVGFLEAAPRFAAREFMAPRRIVFELLDTPDFPPDWFDPETQARER
jgi:hypothetical protein